MQQVMPELLAHRHGQLFKRAVSVAELIKVLEYTMVGVVLQHAAFLKILEEISLYQCGLLGDSVVCRTYVNHSFRPYLACKFHHLVIVLPVCKRFRPVVNIQVECLMSDHSFLYPVKNARIVVKVKARTSIGNLTLADIYSCGFHNSAVLGVLSLMCAASSKRSRSNFRSPLMTCD